MPTQQHNKGRLSLPTKAHAIYACIALCVVKHTLLIAVFDAASQVRSRRNGQILAMKCISKKMLARRNHIAYMQAERDIMTKVWRAPAFYAHLSHFFKIHNARVGFRFAVLFLHLPRFFTHVLHLNTRDTTHLDPGCFSAGGAPFRGCIAVRLSDGTQALLGDGIPPWR